MSDLLVRPWQDQTDPRVISRVTPERAGWELLTMEARRLPAGEAWEAYTGEHEMAIVLLGGTCALETSRGDWAHVGRRQNVFSGMPYACYLPRRTDFRLRASSETCEIAAAWTPTDQDHAPQLITPKDVAIELRGMSNASRQINSIIPPGFDCHCLIAVEVYTPGGNWSSYPPHKHDAHTLAPDGTLTEADLEEIYFYKLDKPEGYAIQQVYTADRRLDKLVRAQDNDTVLIPEGYHPVVAAHGYTTYYLNFLAGSAQSLANTDDPAYAHIRAGWGDMPEKDPRLPLVSHAMERD